MTRLIDADALISDLEYDVELDSRLLDDTGLVGLNRELTQFDKDCKTNIIAYLKEAPTVDTVPVERNIPKAPTDKQLEEDGYGAWGSLYGRCPNCKGTVYDEQNYCEKCGQRLDWGNGGKEIDAMSTIDALPVKHGKWLDYLKEGLKYKCSECESRFNRPYNYCPNCGARMDEE